MIAFPGQILIGEPQKKAGKNLDCPLCGEKVFPEFLDLHMDICPKRLRQQEIVCPWCGSLMSFKLIGLHVTNCKKKPKQ